MSRWLSSLEFADAAGITDRQARRVLKGFAERRPWQGARGKVRKVKGRGGRSGTRYEVLLSSLPEAFQSRLNGLSGGEGCGTACKRDPVSGVIGV